MSNRMSRARSVQRLRALDFDPLEELVRVYKELRFEVERQEKIRTGEVQELGPTGRVRAYRAEVHHALYDKMIAIGDKLMRYGYARIPETLIVDEPERPGLTINLTKEGDTYVIGGGDDDGDAPSGPV
jgi:hypothetical protein